MQTLENLRAQRDRAPKIHGRTFTNRRKGGHNKRGPGRSAKDSPHRKGGRLTLRARLSKRIRQRLCRARRREAQAQRHPPMTRAEVTVGSMVAAAQRSLSHPLARR